jgi:hypothetical protein
MKTALVGGRFSFAQMNEMGSEQNLEQRMSPNADGHSVAYYFSGGEIALGFALVDTTVMPFLYELHYCAPSLVERVKQIHREKQSELTEAVIAHRLREYHFRRKSYKLNLTTTIEYHLGDGVTSEGMAFQFTQIRSDQDLYELAYVDQNFISLAAEKFNYTPKPQQEEHAYDPESPENLPDWSVNDRGVVDPYGHRGPHY